MKETCDQCGLGVAAAFRVIGPKDQELTFCGHHAREHEPKLIDWHFFPVEVMA